MDRSFVCWFFFLVVCSFFLSFSLDQRWRKRRGRRRRVVPCSNGSWSRPTDFLRLRPLPSDVICDHIISNRDKQQTNTLPDSRFDVRSNDVYCSKMRRGIRCDRGNAISLSASRRVDLNGTCSRCESLWAGWPASIRKSLAGGVSKMNYSSISSRQRLTC